MKKCAAIILAAGLSSRMTAFKPLLEVGGVTLTDRLISIYQQIGVDVVLVTGWRNAELAAGLKSKNLIIVNNPDYQEGMFTSLQTGVRALGDRYSGFFVHPVDIPLIRPHTIKLLLEAQAHHPESIISPVFHQARGHPTLIPDILIPRILENRPADGLKTVLKASPELTLDVKTADRNILFDVDTPEDFQELQARFKMYEIPTPDECEAVLRDLCGVSPAIRKHGQRVAEAALSITQALAEKGLNINMEAVRAGALLHDIAKGQSKHDQAGGRLLREMGFSRVGEIVSVHTDLSCEIADWESKIVYLADKLVKGTNRVALAQRYDPSDRPFALTPEIAARISSRRKRAEEVKEEIEDLLGSPLESLVF